MSKKFPGRVRAAPKFNPELGCPAIPGLTKWIRDHLDLEPGVGLPELLMNDDPAEGRMALVSVDAKVDPVPANRLKHYWRVFENGMVGDSRAVPGLADRLGSRELLRCLVCRLQAKERSTIAHSVRTFAISRAYAVGLGLPESELNALRAAALLHDIGKLCIPNRILLKREPLVPPEWALLQKHVEAGARMLSAVDVDPLAVDVVLNHHERFDGQGYPNGHKGRQIPVLARLLSIADCFDAMMSNRPYREAWPPEAAMEHIAAGAGTHFDPELVALVGALPVSTWLARARRFASGLE